MQFLKSSLILLFFASRVVLCHGGDLSLAQGSAPVLSEEGLLEEAKLPFRPPHGPPPSPASISGNQQRVDTLEPRRIPALAGTIRAAGSGVTPRLEVVLSPSASGRKPSSLFIDRGPPVGEAGHGASWGAGGHVPCAPLPRSVGPSTLSLSELLKGAEKRHEQTNWEMKNKLED